MAKSQAAPPLPDPLPTPATITLADIDLFNAAYPRLIAWLASPAAAAAAKPRKDKDLTRLPALDAFRHTVLPQRLAERRAQYEPKPGRPDEADGCLDMAEAKELLEWKMCASLPPSCLRFPPTTLSRSPRSMPKREVADALISRTRGTPRPRLRALLATNTPAHVRTASARAFAAYARHGHAHSPSAACAALTAAGTLAGVGPATGSLFLSAAFPAHACFFSDEAWAWATRGEAAGVKDPKYSAKEYKMLAGKVGDVRERLNGEGGRRSVGAGEVERAAYVVENVRKRGEGCWREMWEGEAVEGQAEEGIREAEEKVRREMEAEEAGGAKKRKYAAIEEELAAKKKKKKPKRRGTRQQLR